MSITVSELATQCQHLLSEDLGEKGRAKVAALLSEILAEPANIDALIPPETGERDMLYEDPELGFCIFAHQYKGPKESTPHDHGPSWAIYAQARAQREPIHCAQGMRMFITKAICMLRYEQGRLV